MVIARRGPRMGRAQRAASARHHGQRVAALLRAVADRAPHLSDGVAGQFAWLERMDEVDVRRFLDEYAAAYQEALESDDWQSLDDVLGEWQVTAEALADPQLRALLHEDSLGTVERVRLDYPA